MIRSERQDDIIRKYNPMNERYTQRNADKNIPNLLKENN